MSRLIYTAIVILLAFGMFVSNASAAPQAFSCANVTEIPQSECQALIAIYNQDDGPSWLDQGNWLVTNTPSNWKGVSVSGGHVTELSLEYFFGMYGSIPIELTNLTYLTNLDISNSNLIDAIPSQLGDMTSLTNLDLSYNQLSGSIPPELGNLKNLTSMNLSSNKLSGSIPPQLGELTNLTDLNLYYNLLSGSIPPELGDLTALTNLDLSHNQLSGSIPPELGKLTSLQFLDLSENQISGSIPPQLGDMTHLLRLYLSNFQLSGSIPPELGNLASLQQLDLYSNQLSGNIPPELGNLTNLHQLDLNNNQLSGSIPSELGNLANLTNLDLSHNQLSGPIPPELGEIGSLVSDVGTTYYRLIVDLSYNQINGSIPPELFNINLLGDLFLDHNQLSGSIPPPSNAFRIYVLELEYNQLIGSIPKEMGNLIWLWDLDLSHNHLSGSIPSQLASICQIPSHGGGDDCTLYLDHNALSGDVPPELANLPPNMTIFPSQILRLDYNLLNVPNPYPSNPPTPLDNFLMANDLGWEKSQRVITTEIPVDGGQMLSGDGRVSLVIPPGGVSQPVTLKFTTNFHPNASTGRLIFAHTGFTLAAYDQGGNLLNPFSFAQPVTITLNYLDNDVAVLKEDQLALYYWDTAASAWKDATQTCSPASIYTRDLVNNTLSLHVCHLSEFALLGSAKYSMMLPLVNGP